MARYMYERVSAQDYQSFAVRTPNLPMHASGTQIFKVGPLKTPDGGIHFSRIKHLYAKLLHLVPRYRQKLVWTPIEKIPVWVDDAHFNIDYHVRHTGLPRPGTEEQLKRLSARIMEKPLDRSKPLWEAWIVEGLEGDRFAIITKTHWCMVDRTSGLDLTRAIMSTEPDYEPHEPPRYIPRPIPSRLELLLDAARWRLDQALRTVRSVQDFKREAKNLRAEVDARISSLRNFLGLTTSSASETPINGEVGPHRIFDWLTMPLSHLKDLHKAFDCTVNDVVLTTVTAAIRDFLQQRGVRPEDIVFRVGTPVSIHPEDDHETLGDDLLSWIVELPIGESDPARQLELIREETRALKESKQALGVGTMTALAEFTPGLMNLAARVTGGSNNTYVANVPGPQRPLYLLGAEMLQLYIQPPLMPNLGLTVGLMSYNGQVCWGFNADSAMVPDLASFVSIVDRSFQRLAETAGITLSGVQAPEKPRSTAGQKQPRARKKNGNGSRAPTP